MFFLIFTMIIFWPLFHANDSVFNYVTCYFSFILQKYVRSQFDFLALLSYCIIFGFVKSQAELFVSYMRSTTLLLFPAVCLHNCHAFSFISFMFNWVSSDLNFGLIQWS